MLTVKKINYKHSPDWYIVKLNLEANKYNILESYSVLS